MSTLPPSMQEDARRAIRELVWRGSRRAYIQGIWGPLFDWQAALIDDPGTRIVVNGARQAGKSTVISGLVAHTARFVPGSLSIIAAATERQAEQDMEKVKDFIALDRSYPEVTRSSRSEIELVNRSRIVIVPATEKSARGYSRPRLVIADEGSRIEDSVYTSGIMPFFTDNADGQFINISTPNGRTGFFARAMALKSWTRYEVFAPYELDDVSLALTPSDMEARIADCMGRGIKAFVSPRHRTIAEQAFNLEQMGAMMYRQECLVEFVEPDDQVFRNADIDYAFGPHEGMKPFLDGSIPEAPGWGLNLEAT